MNDFRGFEWIIVFFILFIVLNSSFKTYQTVMVYAKEVALKSELTEIRNAIGVFRATYGRYPIKLIELEKKGILSFGGNEFFFMKSKINKKNKVGAIMDPFNAPYHYDPKTGKIHSTAKGYEKY